MEFGASVDRATNAKVIALYRRVHARAIPGVIEMIPTFRSLLVSFDPDLVNPASLQEKLLECLDEGGGEVSGGRSWTLPACYEGEFAPDLADVAKEAGLSEAEVVKLHAGRPYFVYMIGFLPGFGYMGDVAEPIRLPRRTHPRTRVPRGSVAIAGEMTAVYSLESPGGWHLLGHTPVPLFDPEADRPVLLAPGDTVTFEPVGLRDHQLIADDIANGRRILTAGEAA